MNELHIDSVLGDAAVCMSRTGKSVVVELRGPFDPRSPSNRLLPPHRVYLPLAYTANASKPRHLVNLALHKSRRWLDICRADFWFALVVVQCRPMRGKSKALLQAIQRTARRHWGDRYWRHPEGRALLRRELSLMGIKCPPDDPLVLSMHAAGFSAQGAALVPCVTET